MDNGKRSELVEDRDPVAGSTRSSGRARRSRAARGGVAAAVALVVLGACSVTETLDTAEGKEKIKTGLESKIPGSTVDGVSCPEREINKGDVFECTARVDGQPLRIQIIQDDDEGNVTMKPMQAILEVKQAVAYVEQEVGKAKRSAVTANCGTSRYLVKDPGTTFDCPVTTKAGRAVGRAVVTVKDVEGNVELSLA